jgi:acetyltransferase-like isoleucine patch superfamily enzyme
MNKSKKSQYPDEIWNPEDKGVGKTQMQASLTDPKKSPLKKYQELAVGSTSLTKMLKFEVLTCFLSPMPGAIGLFLRKIFFKFLFAKVGKNVVFGKSLTIRHPNKIQIGDNVVIDDYAVLDAKGIDNKGIIIGNDVIIGRNTVISCKNGDIIIGDNSNIAMNCFIQSAKEVKIGKNVLISAYCYIIGGGDHRTERTDIPIIAQAQVVQGINFEDNCLIGAGVMVQDGVTIGRDCIIGTGSVVTKSIPKFVISTGVPATIIKSRLASE